MRLSDRRISAIMGLMTCCILGLLILTAVGRVRRAVGVGRKDAPVLFAPVAFRPAPGQAAAIEYQVPPDSYRGSSGSAVFGYCALGIALSLIVTPALVLAGVADSTGPAWVWLLRSAFYVLLIAAALVLRRSAPVGRRLRGAGWLLVFVGAVIFEIGVLDMHVFAVVEIENMLGDMIFHSTGPVLAAVGALLVSYGAAGRRNTSRRSSRSTLTSARPSSSAVTVSSTPPVTR